GSGRSRASARASGSSTATKCAPRSRPGSARARRGSGAPLLFELPPVLLVDPEILVAAEPPERRHLPVVHERVAGAQDLVARRGRAAVVVPVFEHPEAEAFVEKSDPVESLAAQRDAEECERGDLERLA